MRIITGEQFKLRLNLSFYVVNVWSAYGRISLLTQYPLYQETWLLCYYRDLVVFTGILLPKLKFSSFPCPIPINGYEVIECKKVVEMISEDLFLLQKIKDERSKFRCGPIDWIILMILIEHSSWTFFLIASIIAIRFRRSSTPITRNSVVSISIIVILVPPMKQIEIEWFDQSIDFWTWKIISITSFMYTHHTRWLFNCNWFVLVSI